MQINLLAPQTSMQKQMGFEKSSKIVFFSSIGVVGVLLLTALVLFILQINAQSNIKDANAQILALNNVAQKLNQRNEMQRTINFKNTNINKLVKARPIWTTKLDVLEKLVPQNISYRVVQFDNKTGKGTLEGSAPGYDQIAQVLANLQAAPYFEKSVLSEISREESTPGVTFKITLYVAGGEQK